MFRYHALGGVSLLVLCTALLPSTPHAQTAAQSLPPVTVDAPRVAVTRPVARKPSTRASARTQVRPPSANTTPAVSQAARVTIRNVGVESGRLTLNIFVENLTGHKLPTAFPSRRAWLHVVVRDRDGKAVFESGALNPDGSIRGNDADAEPTRFEPHYREIKNSEEVQIYEPILRDQAGHVTTGLAAAVGYLKDNRLLPSGFQKETADKDIAVVGDAADDPNFTAAGDLVRYSVALGDATGPFHVEAELWYQPTGFRWAHNLEPYQAAEARRFVGYYQSMASGTAIVLARAEATR